MPFSRGLVIWFVVLLSCCVGLALSARSMAATPPTVVFAVNAPGTKPYLYFDEKTGLYQGIVVDFFAAMPSDQQVVVQYLDTSRGRYEQTLLAQKADVFISAKDWLRLPQAFLYSDTVAPHESHLYATSRFYGDAELYTSGGATICTRTNFVYPTLQPHFANGDAIRLDSTTNSTMTAMLLKHRCKFMVLGKDDAHAELFEPSYCQHEFHQSPQAISSVNMVFVVTPERADLLQTLNTQLQLFIRSGQRDQSIRKHSGVQQFPKLKGQGCSAAPQ